MTLTGKLIVIDPVTDATETADSAVVRNMETGQQATITDSAKIRALYDHPSATAYGEGSYTVEIESEDDDFAIYPDCRMIADLDKALAYARERSEAEPNEEYRVEGNVTNMVYARFRNGREQ